MLNFESDLGFNELFAPGITQTHIISTFETSKLTTKYQY